MDIAKFFLNIDKEVLMGLLDGRVADEKLLRLMRTIIFDGDEYEGLPIGNYTSQYFANIYMNELDQYVKREMRQKYYLRYMDDFVCLVGDRAEARKVYGMMREFLRSRLRLPLNPKSCYYPARFGVDFVGFRTWEDFRLVRKRSLASVYGIRNDYARGVDDDVRHRMRMESWRGHVIHADAWRLVTKNIPDESEI